MAYLKEIEQEEFSVAIPADLNETLARHLIRDDRQEDVAFALYKPSAGSTRFTSLIHQVLLPLEGERQVHGNVTINPAFFRRACKEASMQGSGLVLLHSHPSCGWQAMSDDDVTTEMSYSSSSLTVTELPLVGLTLGNDGTWSARIWEYNRETYKPKFASTVRVVGKRLEVSYYDDIRLRPNFRPAFKRTLTVWGEQNHAHLARLRVGVVGVGSVGSLVVDALARMGVERITMLDFDEIREHNLDRLTGASFADLGKLKVDVAAERVRVIATGEVKEVNPVPFGVTERQGYARALDCDIIFSCVDRPWPRYVLNNLAYGHLIPVVDGGIGVRFKKESTIFEGADWQLQSVGPQRPCLHCLKAYDAADVQLERDGMLDDPSYISGLPENHRFKRNENIFPFSMNLASLEIMQFIAQVTGIGGTDYFGTQRFSYTHGFIRKDEAASCEPGCYFQSGIALGDTQFGPPHGRDHSAEAARLRQREGIPEWSEENATT
ncbi:HesA/MoeB/ThiF family protein [Dyadobacter sp. BHUBP1]|uniref:HesA/MoeB/ThiF family protein n=1 Tax=Dyadobacter sp. BHUBP1 TaxID=3424178 RepID=UPI003D32987E